MIIDFDLNLEYYNCIHDVILKYDCDEMCCEMISL